MLDAKLGEEKTILRVKQNQNPAILLDVGDFLAAGHPWSHLVTAGKPGISFVFVV